MTWWVLCFLFACFSLAIWDVFVGSCCSVTRWCLTLWDSMNCSIPWFPVFQYLWCLLKVMSMSRWFIKGYEKLEWEKEGKRPITTGVKILHPCENSSLSSFLTIYSMITYYILCFMLFVWRYWVLVVVCKIFIVSCGIFHCGTRTSCSMWAHGLCPTGSRVCGLKNCAQTHLLRGIWNISSLTRDWTYVLFIARWNLNQWTPREVPVCISSYFFSRVTKSFWDSENCPFSMPLATY